MKRQMVLSIVTTVGVLSMPALLPVRPAEAQPTLPLVFQAAGPTAAAIQGTVDAFRAALGDPDNGNNAGPLATGRREINWDGGGSTDTTDPVTPFDVFLNSRGAQFTTPGSGLSQAPPSGGTQGGLAVLFNNPTYADIFTPFSAPRLFTPVGSRITNGLFFLPGTAGATPAVVTGFGVVFTDVDRPRGSGEGGSHATKIEYFDADGRTIFTGLVPSAPGDGGLSFFGVVFEDARIARVRITTGSTRPGQDDTRTSDIVMMDNFIYGEPQEPQPLQ
jgi:hypothetical protein